MTTAASMVPPSPLMGHLNDLYFALEELLKRIADTDDLEIRRRRAQVWAEMIAMQNHAAISTAKLPEQAALKDTRETWVAQAVVALAGAVMALSVFRNTDRRDA